MPVLRYSSRAKDDLAFIARFGEGRWGRMQARKYQHEIRICCARLAHLPKLGRPAEDILPGFRRVECGRHVIFYTVDGASVVVRRILDKSASAEQHVI